MKKLAFSCYLSSLATLGVAIYMIFFSNLEKLQVQGIYWFAIAIVCFILPSVGPAIDKIGKLRINKDSLEFEFKEIKEKIERIEIGSQAVSKIYEYLYHDNQTWSDEFGKLLEKAPENALTSVHATATEFREKTVFQVLGIKDRAERAGYQKKFEKLIPVFSALIQAENKDRANLHNYYAQLAYVYKDQPNRDWINAYRNIDKAIKFRDEQTLGYISLTIYEFNRLMCSVNIPPEMRKAEQIEHDFAVVHTDTRKRYMLFDTDPILAPNLHEWVTTNKPKEYAEWQKEKRAAKT